MAFLFEKDVVNRTFVDYLTTNDSFLKMHYILKRMNITNNKFFLCVTDKDLIGVDPHNLQDDSEELKLKIAYECKINPWYFFREVSRIPELGANKGVKFKLNRANLALYWCFLNHIDILLVVPRQITKTMSCMSLSSWLIYIAGINFKQALLTKDNKNRVKNVGDLKQMRDLFPSYLIDNRTRDTDNTESISYTALNNEYVTFVAQKALMAAEGMGRGMTLPVQFWDEVAYFKYIHITYPQAISSTNAAVEAAKLNDQPYGNILTTTAGQLNIPEGKYIYNLLLNSLSFTEKLYDVNNRDDLLEIVRANSKQRMIYAEFSFLQLGKTIEWFKEKTSRASGSIDTTKRDYLNIFTYGSTEAAVKEKILLLIKKNQRDPIFIQQYESFIVRWYITQEEFNNQNILNMPIIIGSDPSEAISEDYFSFVFVNPINLSVLATCRCNLINLVEIALFVITIIEKFKNSLLIMERNSTGIAIIDILLRELPKRGINPFKKLFNRVVQEKETNEFKDIDIENPFVSDSLRKHFGFRLTSSKSEGRSFMYKNVFFEALDLSADKIYDKDLINEICGLQKKNGRIDHSTDNHDDLVVAFIYAFYVLLYGKNLKFYDFYKYHKDKIMRDKTYISKDVDENYNDIMDVDLINKKIDDLDKDIRNENNEINKIRKLHQKLELKQMLSDSKEKTLLISDTDGKIKTFQDLSLIKQPIKNLNMTNYFDYF